MRIDYPRDQGVAARSTRASTLSSLCPHVPWAPFWAGVHSPPRDQPPDARGQLCGQGLLVLSVTGLDCGEGRTSSAGKGRGCPEGLASERVSPPLVFPGLRIA